MSKHTPGPWRIERKDNGVVRILGRPMDPTVRVNLSGWAAICAFGATRMTDSDGKANAKLIAAAPELLEALKQITHFAGHVALKDREADWGAVIDAAKAAIAKAEGQR